MYYVETYKGKRFYKLTEEECKIHKRLYPTYCYWYDEEDIGNMGLTEDEGETIEELKERW